MNDDEVIREEIPTPPFLTDCDPGDETDSQGGETHPDGWKEREE